MIESSTIEALMITLMITFGIIFVTFLVNVLILSSITRDIVGFTILCVNFYFKLVLFFIHCTYPFLIELFHFLLNQQYLL
jgi:hypothetical protein